jgi:hypothetical protein
MQNTTAQWGACYFDHFVKFFGNPSGRMIFEQDSASPSIQILSFDNIFEECRVFATLGLSHYADELGNTGEIVAPVDDCWQEVPVVLANALFYMVQNRMRLGRGVAIGGIGSIHQRLALSSQKSALYVTDPFGMPDGFESVPCNERVGRVYVGFFISDSEMKYFSKHGAESFEDLIETKDIDPYNLMRSSAI